MLHKETRRDREREKSCTNLVSTFCYLSLEGELGQLLHGWRGKSFLRRHPHAAEYDNDHGEDEEDAARDVDEDVGVLVFFLWAHCFRDGRKGGRNREKTHRSQNFYSKDVLFCSVASLKH